MPQHSNSSKGRASCEHRCADKSVKDQTTSSGGPFRNLRDGQLCSKSLNSSRVLILEVICSGFFAKSVRWTRESIVSSEARHYRAVRRLLGVNNKHKKSSLRLRTTQARSLLFQLFTDSIHRTSETAEVMDMLLIVLGVKLQANNIQRSDLIEGECVHVIGRLVILLAFEVVPLAAITLLS